MSEYNVKFSTMRKKEICKTKRRINLNIISRAWLGDSDTCCHVSNNDTRLLEWKSNNVHITAVNENQLILVEQKLRMVALKLSIILIQSLKSISTFGKVGPDFWFSFPRQ